MLIKLTGRDAISFIQDQMLANEAVGYEFTKGSDELVSKHFDKQLDNSNKIPQKGKYAGKENAKVIDEYNLFINNCATTSMQIKLFLYFIISNSSDTMLILFRHYFQTVS